MCVKNWLKIPNRLEKISENRRGDFFWLTLYISEQAHNNIAVLHELIMMEQFNSHIEPAMDGWLIDQKPQSMSDFNIWLSLLLSLSLS